MEEFSLIKFGERFREVRTRTGFGLRQFCREYKLNAEKWGLLEKGKKSLSLELLTAHCKQFDLSPLWLLFGIAPESLKDAERVLNSSGQSTESLGEVLNFADDNSRKNKNPKLVKSKVRRGAGRT